MGKRKVYSERDISETLVTPGEGQLFGRVEGLSGSNWATVLCSDGKIRQCRLRGKLRRKIWIKLNDIVLVEPWSFQPDRGEILHRYTIGQIDYLIKNGFLSKELVKETEEQTGGASS
ncbi:MAG: translation initiation factor eIF-1A [Thaumarchaeota archaeon]|nr:translation initiation factor eIF-1A [Nitrososphaerota archaeon]